MRQPGQEDQVEDLAAAQLARRRLVDEAALDGAARTSLRSSMPAPSSSTSMTTWLPRCCGANADRAASGLPTLAAARPASRCRDRWQLRITCISGSDSSSTISLSSSVSAPEIAEPDLLAGVARRSCAPRAPACRRPGPSGTMRTSRMPSCSSSSLRSSARSSRCRSRASSAWAAARASRGPGSRRSAGAAPMRQLADDVHQVVELANVDAHRLRDRLERQLVVVAIEPARLVASAAPSESGCRRRRAVPRRVGAASVIAVAPRGPPEAPRARRRPAGRRAPTCAVA